MIRLKGAAIVVLITLAGCQNAPPRPLSSPELNDYIALQRVDNLVDEYAAFPIARRCWHDPEYVARYCPWACADGSDPVFPLSANEMLEFAMMGMALEAGRIRFIDALLMDNGEPKPNGRCDPEHAQYHPEFCGRSNVRKVKEAQLAAEIEINLALAEELRELAQKDGIRKVCEYDSIKGWCECRNENGGPRSRCENGDGC
jgi:hypothetical protein